MVLSRRHLADPSVSAERLLASPHDRQHLETEADWYSFAIHRRRDTALGRAALEHQQSADYGRGFKYGTAWLVGNHSSREGIRSPILLMCSTKSLIALARAGAIQGTAIRAAIFRQQSCARKSRPAASATPAAASFPRTGCPAGPCRIPISYHR